METAVAVSGMYQQPSPPLAAVQRVVAVPVTVCAVLLLQALGIVVEFVAVVRAHHLSVSAAGETVD